MIFGEVWVTCFGRSGVFFGNLVSWPGVCCVSFVGNPDDRVTRGVIGVLSYFGFSLADSVGWGFFWSGGVWLLCSQMPASKWALFLTWCMTRMFISDVCFVLVSCSAILGMI